MANQNFAKMAGVHSAGHILYCNNLFLHSHSLAMPTSAGSSYVTIIFIIAQNFHNLF